ncbi:GDNF-inducible zinc finger protein 1 [Portunus trituberculatus]|uniref:GDNF-inducible zinc finger protein 1 n=1 Tax=Portunus trituberculatus TaxID=210409 RepID=A0A5B7HC41_PORTR|nr:GDNF-inducible zinc finger protein 1 [Portunus trituberculatus]
MNKTFGCTHCSKRFRSEAALQEHFNVHTGNRPYACDQCCKKFTSKHILKTHMKTHGVRQRPHQCRTCVVAAEGGKGEGGTSPGTTVRTMKLDEDQSLEPSLDGSVQLVRGGVRDGETVEVVSRPVHIIEADDLPRYIIHTTGGGERTEEGVGHFFASLQGQVVEVRAEDLERYTDLTPDQMTQVAQVAAQVVTGQPATSGIQQVSVSSDLRPFNIQLEPATREVTLQTQPSSSREVSASIGVATGTVTTRDVTLPTISHVQGGSGAAVLVGGRQVNYEPGGLGQGTLRKVLTDREELRTISVHNMGQSDTRTVRHWQQQPVTTPANNFIGD